MNARLNKLFSVCVGFLLLTVFLSGCSAGNASGIAPGERVWTVDSENAARVFRDGTVYRVTGASVEASRLGGWVGVVKTAVVLDEHGTVLKSRKLDRPVRETVLSLEEDLPPGARVIVPFQNVYTVKGEEEEDAVAVGIGNNDFYRAVPEDAVSGADAAIDYEKASGVTGIGIENTCEENPPVAEQCRRRICFGPDSCN